MEGTRRLGLLGLTALALLGLALPADDAGARKRHHRKPGIYVSPGPDAIANAIDRAKPGGTIRIRKGRYHEAVVIDKPVRLIAANKILPVIDGDCDTRVTV